MSVTMNDLDENRARAVLANSMPNGPVICRAHAATLQLRALERAGFKLVREEVLNALRDRAKANPDG